MTGTACARPARRASHIAVFAVALMLAGCLTGTPPAQTDTASSQATDSAMSTSPGQGTTAATSAPPATTSAATTASDPLHWSGTIEVEESIFILPWQTLTIEPGTVVRFHKLPDVNGTDWSPHADAYIKDHDDPTGRQGYKQSHFEVYGKVIAIGTKEAPILFTSAQAVPEYADWSQLILATGSRLENVTVEYSHNGINIQGDGVVLRNVTSHDALWSCIDSFGSADMRDIEAYHCWHQAVGFKEDGHNVLARAYLHDANLAVNCEHGATPVLQDLRTQAARFNMECPAVAGLVEEPGGADVAGGTYGGRLIYPYQG